jgi:hypothetical protein
MSSGCETCKRGGEKEEESGLTIQMMSFATC